MTPNAREDHRVAITGVGLLTPLGLSVDATWSALLNGESGVTGFALDAALHVAVAPLTDGDLGTNARLRAVADRCTVLGASAAAMALESAGIGAGFHSYSPERTAIMVGTSFGGIGSLIDEDRRTRDGTFRVSPRLVTRAIPSALASYLAIEYEVRGPVMTYLGACAASAQAIGEAMVSILVGRCDVALCGGADTLFVEPIMRSLAVTGALATLGPAESATHAVKPFGCERRGMALGEGAAFLVLERESAARARGSAVLAYLTGYGSGNDAYHVTAPEPSGFGAERVMRMALASADAQPSDVGYVSAHATGTEVGDIAEAAALGRVFVENPAVPVSSVKGALGHSLGAAGAIEAALAIQVLRTGWMPPNTGTDRPDDAAPRGILREATQIGPGGLVLSNSFGFGGHNVSLVFAPMED